jgi:hypothetical protein
MCWPLKYVYDAREWVVPESGPLDVESWQGRELTLTAQPAAWLEVRLGNEVGHPIEGSLRLFDAEGRAFDPVRPALDGLGAWIDRLTDDPHSLGPLPPGTWRIEARTPSGRTALTSVTLLGGEHQRIALKIEP